MKKNLSTLAALLAVSATFAVMAGCDKEPGPSEAPPDAVTKTADEVNRENGGQGRQKLGEGQTAPGAPEGGRADRSGG